MKQLMVSDGELAQHFRAINKILTAAVEPGSDVELAVEWPPQAAVAGIVGSGCEYVVRNRGLRSPVAPYMQLSHELWAWIGYREEWVEEKAAGKHRRRFSYKSSGITVHLGEKNDARKPQLFRAEWAGWARWHGDLCTFQAEDAGHPHWQFDALDTLRDSAAEQAQEILNQLRDGANDEPADFVPSESGAGASDPILTHPLSRIHFASAAAWWSAEPNNKHAHAPEAAVEVQRWLQNLLSYLRVEMRRLS